MPLTHRNNNKQVDISRTIRLSGLSSGAKLELVLLSRSPSVVSVALQLPGTEAQDIPNGRLTDKFPSTTTLWLILRKFESGTAGGAGATRNFTARGAPQISNSPTGAGRLYYETPVLQVMGRELSSFTDLQKTLAQLGFNSGSILLRLSFKTSETPLEEAMGEIEQYFKTVQGEVGEGSRGAHAGSVAHSESMLETSQSAIPEDASGPQSPPEPAELLSSSIDPSTTSSNTSEKRKADYPPPVTSPSEPEPTITGPNHRPISVFAPPSNATPHAARQTYNEADYEPTIDHAKLHQSRLSTDARNKRLPTDAELAAQQTAHAQKLAEVKEVEIKVRFPDQTQVVSKFSNVDTAGSLYDFVRGLLENENEPFSLSFSAARGPRVVPKESKDKLIGGLGMIGRVLVNFNWDEGASAPARLESAVKEQWRQKAREIEVREPESSGGVEEMEVVSEGKGKEKAEAKEKGKGGIPKWLKLPGKK